MGHVSFREGSTFKVAIGWFDFIHQHWLCFWVSPPSYHDFQKGRLILRKFPHTQGTYPGPWPTCLWRESFYIWILAYLRGVCWNFLRLMLNSFWASTGLRVKGATDCVFFSGTSDTNCGVIIFNQLPVNQCKKTSDWYTCTILYLAYG